MTIKELMEAEVIQHVDDSLYTLRVLNVGLHDTACQGQGSDHRQYRIDNYLLLNWYRPAEVESFL